MALSVIVGALVGFFLVALFMFVLTILPMLDCHRRIGELTLAKNPQGQITPDGTPIPVTGGTVRLPQINWSLVMTDEEKASRDALMAEISSMPETSHENPFTWLVLPNPIDGWYGEERFESLSWLVDCVYDEKPELSVYTDGQSLMASVVVSRCHLFDSDGDDKETNETECETVVRAADRLHLEIESEIAKSSGEGWMTECSADEAYVILLYERLSSMTTYADDDGDTKHANDIYGALLEDESKCYGVTSAAKALLNRRGIPSFMASGSVAGDDDRRHAWIVMWMGGQWRTLDITTGQGQVPPQTVNVTEALAGSPGYWGGCMRPFDEFVEQWDMVVDEPCLRLMSAYEESIGVA